ncbi:MAG: hypothetical protein ACOVO9_08580 [Bacteroidia bacterium]
MKLLFKIEKVAENYEEEMALNRRSREEDLIHEEHSFLMKKLVTVFYIISIMAIVFIMLMEVKRVYRTDFFQDYNFPFEDSYYGITKGLE